MKGIRERVRQPERHFSVVWHISMANVALLTALVLVPGVPRSVVTHYAVFAFGWFLSSEWSAGGVKRGFSGTKTAWLYYHVREDFVRVLIGVWMGVLMFVAFPAHWTFRVLAAGFTLWLPAHYAGHGTTGPVDWLARWLGRITGLGR